MLGFNLINSEMLVPCALAIAERVSPDFILYEAEPVAPVGVGVGVGVGEGVGVGVGEAGAGEGAGAVGKLRDAPAIIKLGFVMFGLALSKASTVVPLAFAKPDNVSPDFILIVVGIIYFLTVSPN